MLTGSGDSATPSVEETTEKVEEQQTTIEKEEVEATQTVVVSELKK